MLVEDGLDAAGFFSEVNFVISNNEDSFDAGGVSAAVVTLAQSVIANNDATGGRGDDLCSINPGVYASQGGT